MKTNFKKTLAVLLAVLMLTSVFSVTAFAAVYTAKIQKGSAAGSTQKATLEDGTPITTAKLSLKSNSSGVIYLPSEAYFERSGYVQDGWTTNAAGTGALLKFGSKQTLRNNNTKYYPHWLSTSMTVTFTANEDYIDNTDVNNFTDSTMTTIKSTSQVISLGDSFDFPGAVFTRPGYTQTGWTTAVDGTGTRYDLNSTFSGTLTNDTVFYPYWSPITYQVKFEGGAYGTGTTQQFDVLNGSLVTAPGAIFTRVGYTQIGWATVDGSDTVEVGLNTQTPAVSGNISYYPVWRVDVYAVSFSATSANFGTKCEGYVAPSAETVTVINNGNTVISFTLPVSVNYDVSLESGSLTLGPEESFTVSIQPKEALAAGVYNEALEFVSSRTELSTSVDVSFKVFEHVYGKYVSNGDATYTSDGTKTAKCLNGCGATHSVSDPGSMKVYSIDNNDAVGLSSSYEYHKTIRFKAYGSGMDDEEHAVGKRFLPVSWYVNDDLNGEFENGEYDVVYTHSGFGEYTLIINYVEQQFNAESGEWTNTGVTDTKTFDYTVGPTEKEEQEVILPQTILGTIAKIFALLLSLLGIGA